MTELAKLIARVEAATGPDRELDEAIALFEGWTKHSDIDSPVYQSEINVWWAEPGREWSTVSTPPTYTASIDAALGLVERVLPGWRVMLQIGGAYDRGTFMGHAGCSLYHPLSSGAVTAKGFSSTAPLAILLALLRALSARSP